MLATEAACSAGSKEGAGSASKASSSARNARKMGLPSKGLWDLHGDRFWVSAWSVGGCNYGVLGFADIGAPSEC